MALSDFLEAEARVRDAIRGKRRAWPGLALFGFSGRDAGTRHGEANANEEASRRPSLWTPAKLRTSTEP